MGGIDRTQRRRRRSEREGQLVDRCEYFPGGLLLED